ncbi:dihydroneopterin aldolase [Halarcobacter mediterraneus]|uniref:Dihydroneopterin aldolase n=1 Tax=Halarcobacter mediterraneus TaxID=2023153 RepID=A0A4Q1AWA8_9BACT|nr:dihydroneopterin aldolase [Halarcobacter mediterraneus]RXK13351.1 dihydroneopterin aldolase [Halarcobacter mediterraneus]
MKINIENLSFKCIIGILDFERIKKQKVNINIFFEYDFKKDYFIDYSEVASRVEKKMKEKKFFLLEDAIKYLEKYLNKKYKISNLSIKISKPDILKNCIVSLEN